MAPSTPPPPSKEELAAFTMASTFILVMLSMITSICVITEIAIGRLK
jgi:hypothetical protein